MKLEQIHSFIYCPRVVQGKALTGGVVKIFERLRERAFCGNIGVIGLEPFKFQSPLAPLIIADDIIVQTIIYNAVNQNLPPSSGYQLFD